VYEYRVRPIGVNGIHATFPPVIEKFSMVCVFKICYAKLINSDSW
jgi:hypothetical protein